MKSVKLVEAGARGLRKSCFYNIKVQSEAARADTEAAAGDPEALAKVS